MKRLWQQVLNESLLEFKKVTQGLENYLTSLINEPAFNGRVILSYLNSSLIEYEGKGYPIIFVPSLLNKAYILDLSPAESFIKRLCPKAFKPFLVDWGEFSDPEKEYTIDDYINLKLIPYIEHIKEKYNVAPILTGYCMGGILALSVAQIRPELISKVITIAMPWDFAVKGFIKIDSKQLFHMINLHDVVPNSFIKAIFYMSNFYNINQKYVKFSEGINKQQALIEHWANDARDLSKRVFDECLTKWINNNELLCNKWRVGGQTLNVENLKTPILALIAQNDKVVPYSSAIAFSALPNVTTIKYETGHIGMIVNPKYKAAKHIKSWCDTLSIK